MACGSIGGVLKKSVQNRLGRWLCLLGSVLHLLAAFGHACPGGLNHAEGHDLVWSYTYHEANQLTGWEKRSGEGEALQKSAVLTYDAAGNRTRQSVTQHMSASVPSTMKPPPASIDSTTYEWDAMDRLIVANTANDGEHRYEYNYRTRRIGTVIQPRLNENMEKRTAVVFSGGLSVAEWESENGEPSTNAGATVEYTRGPDMGGGVGGLLYSLRGVAGGLEAKFNLSNGRGDIVAQSNGSGELSWTASYEAYGRRTKETGENADKQRGNSKDEDATGLLNEGFRYRDLESGVWLSRDPAGFVDGPNLYAYVMQNPWTAFDPDGLAEKKGYYSNKKTGGVTRLEADEKGEPLTRTGKDGKLEVLANHYTDWGDKHFSWFNGPQGEPNSSGWEPAANYGVKNPTSSAKKNFVTNENWDPQKNMQAFGDAASHPTVKAAGTAARVSIEASVMVLTGGMSRVGGAVSAAETSAVAKAGVTVSQPNRIYSARELIRRANEPGPFHNFPESFNAQIFKYGTKTFIPNFWRNAKPNMSNDSIMYSLPGQVNGRSGMFEIGVRPSASGRTEVITHRFFKPSP